MSNILRNDFDNLYIICSKTSHIKKNNLKRCNIIISHKIDEISIIAYLLRDKVSIYLPDFYENLELINMFIDFHINDEKISNLNPEVLLNVSKKIKIPKSMQEKLSNLNSTKDIIEKSIVHKNYDKNVLISNCYSEGIHGQFFMRGYKKLNEIQLDHSSSDHVESIILTEICREACIASSESLLNKHEYFIPIKDEKIYRKFISSNFPIYIQTFVIHSRKSEGFCLFTIWQNNICCLKGYIVGKIYGVNKRDRLAGS
ncbi:AfsA-related hotdog domain-containing protein [Apilactobacillus quenuiae]|uniref:AfsA-related hotdog domain-containing protein n=1 Tax=Apilactobacillus quenuiae TaxID=2008377 RepID=UPI000D021E81|nr:AfsA-related hotdog domain-containing protein [Apilactobacillus quenuiae]